MCDLPQGDWYQREALGGGNLRKKKLQGKFGKDWYWLCALQLQGTCKKKYQSLYLFGGISEVDRQFWSKKMHNNATFCLLWSTVVPKALRSLKAAILGIYWHFGLNLITTKGEKDMGQRNVPKKPVIRAVRGWAYCCMRRKGKMGRVCFQRPASRT